MPIVEHDHVVETLLAQRPDGSFGHGVRAGSPEGRSYAVGGKYSIRISRRPGIDVVEASQDSRSR
jgi:hypothetical protein